MASKKRNKPDEASSSSNKVPRNTLFNLGFSKTTNEILSRLELLTPEDDRFLHVLSSDEEVLPVSIISKKRLSELADKAKEMALSNNFDEAQKLQEAVVEGESLAKTQSQEFELVHQCWKDANSCYHMYLNARDYKTMEQWSKVRDHLDNRLKTYFGKGDKLSSSSFGGKAVATQSEATNNTATTTDEASDGKDDEEVEGANVSQDDITEEEEEEEDSGNTMDSGDDNDDGADATSAVDLLEDKRHRASRPQKIQQHKLTSSTRNLGLGKAKKCAGKHSLKKFNAKLSSRCAIVCVCARLYVNSEASLIRI